MGKETPLEEKDPSGNSCDCNDKTVSTDIKDDGINEEVTVNNSIIKPVQVIDEKGYVSETPPNDASTEIQNNCDNNDVASSKSPIKDLCAKAIEINTSPQKLQESMDKLNISGENLNKSEVIVNSQSESLRNILTYDSNDSSSEDDSDVQEYKESQKNWRNKNDDTSGSSDSESDSSQAVSDSDSDTDSDSDSSSIIVASDDSPNANSGNNITPNTGAVKKNNRTGYDPDEFLSPVPDISKLNINVEKEEFIHIGAISGIISEIVTIATNPGTPAFDIDTCLFIDDEKNGKKPLGTIFDVLGPVSEPMYCIRYNSSDEVKELNVDKGTKVYAAPRSDLTRFVFLKELLKMKGSDASWMNDQEEPPEMAEFSDDEKEREAKRNKKGCQKRKYDDSLERHKRYEKTMNQCNIIKTRVSKMMDGRKSAGRQISQSTFVPQFNPSVPPPGFGTTYNQFYPSSFNPLPMPTFMNQGYYQNMTPVAPPPNFAFSNSQWSWQQPPQPNDCNNSGSHQNSSTNL